MRAFISDTTLSSSSAVCALSSRLLDENRSASLGDHIRDDGANGGRAQDLLRLALELRFGQSHSQNGRQAGEDVVLLELVPARP
jgi:hypothetical protein